MDKQNPSALIGCGFAFGFICGALIAAPLMAPIPGEKFLVTYGSALGALMTGVAAFVVVGQIFSSSRQHRQILEADFQRAQGDWARSDDALDSYVRGLDPWIEHRWKTFVVGNEEVLYGINGPGPKLPWGVISREARQDIPLTGHPEVLMRTASPAVATAFLDFMDAMREANKIAAEFRSELDNPVYPAMTTEHNKVDAKKIARYWWSQGIVSDRHATLRRAVADTRPTLKV